MFEKIGAGPNRSTAALTFVLQIASLESAPSEDAQDLSDVNGDSILAPLSPALIKKHGTKSLDIGPNFCVANRFARERPGDSGCCWSYVPTELPSAYGRKGEEAQDLGDVDGDSLLAPLLPGLVLQLRQDCHNCEGYLESEGAVCVRESVCVRQRVSESE